FGSAWSAGGVGTKSGCLSWLSGLYAAVSGSDTRAELGFSKSKAEVRSPHTVLRHCVMLVSISPEGGGAKRRSRKRIREVWSKVSEHTNPPLLQGEITIIGTRTPRPQGPPVLPRLPAKIS